MLCQERLFNFESCSCSCIVSASGSNGPSIENVLCFLASWWTLLPSPQLKQWMEFRRHAMYATPRIWRVDFILKFVPSLLYDFKNLFSSIVESRCCMFFLRRASCLYLANVMVRRSIMNSADWEALAAPKSVLLYTGKRPERPCLHSWNGYFSDGRWARGFWFLSAMSIKCL